MNKAAAGHLAKAGVEAGVVLKEFKVPADDLANFKTGDTIGLDTLSVGHLVYVTGTTKGRGFSGVILQKSKFPNGPDTGKEMQNTRRG